MNLKRIFLFVVSVCASIIPIFHWNRFRPFHTHNLPVWTCMNIALTSAILALTGYISISIIHKQHLSFGSFASCHVSIAMSYKNMFFLPRNVCTYSTKQFTTFGLPIQCSSQKMSPGKLGIISNNYQLRHHHHTSFLFYAYFDFWLANEIYFQFVPTFNYHKLFGAKCTPH